jgi:hypothetical protein
MEYTHNPQRSTQYYNIQHSQYRDIFQNQLLKSKFKAN